MIANVNQLVGSIYVNAGSSKELSCSCRHAMLDVASGSIKMTLLKTAKYNIREVPDLSTYLQYLPPAKRNGGERCKSDLDVNKA